MCTEYIHRCGQISGRRCFTHHMSYSALQLCSWPGAACWPPSSYRPQAPVSRGGLKCGDPAHRRRWLGSGPACWNSAACPTAHPDPEQAKKCLISLLICDERPPDQSHVNAAAQHDLRSRLRRTDGAPLDLRLVYTGPTPNGSTQRSYVQ